MKRSLASISFLFYLLLLAFGGEAQPLYDQSAVVKYASKNAVILEDREVVEIKTEKDKPVIYHNHLVRTLYQNDKTVMDNEKVIPFWGDRISLEEARAFTWVPQPDGKGYKKIKAGEPLIYDNIDENLFYDDRKEAKFRIPATTKGSVSEINYTYKISDHRFTFPFYFRHKYNAPVVETEFTLIYPLNYKISVKYFGDTSGISFSEQVQKGKKILKWKLNDIDQEKRFSDGPTFQYFSPHIHFMIESFTVKNKTERIFGGVEDLYRENFEFIRELNQEAAHPELKEVMDSLAKGMSDTLEIVKKAYYWVQDNIRYIAFEDGMGGFYPRNSNSIFQKKYGDCKDMAALLQYMLKEAGIVSRLCWVGTREIPYTYAELPNMSSSNHMILAWMHQGRWEFLDPTSNKLPFGFPSTFIQGKEAMIAIDEKNFIIEKIPEAPAELNSSVDSVILSIGADGMLLGKGFLEISGFQKWQFLGKYLSRTPIQKDEMMKNFLKKGNNKSEVTAYTITGDEQIEGPIKISYEFTIADYLKLIDEDIYLNLNLNRPLENTLLDAKERKVPLWLMYKFFDKNIVRLELPEEYDIVSLPGKKQFSDAAISFSSSYEKLNQAVHYNFMILSEDRSIDPPEFQNWNEGIRKLGSSYKESIILKKKQL